MPLFSIYKISNPLDEPILVGALSHEPEDSLQEIRKKLDSFATFDFAYDFWDLNHRVRQNRVFERGIKITDVGGKVTVIPSKVVSTKEQGNILTLNAHFGQTCNSISSCEEVSCRVDGSSHNSNSAQEINPGDTQGVSCEDLPSSGPTDMPPNLPLEHVMPVHQLPTPNGQRKGFHSKLIKQDLLDCLDHAILKLDEYMTERKMEEHKWDVRTWDEDGEAQAKLWCNECNQPMALVTLDKSSITNCFSNFKQHHVGTKKHYAAYCRKRKLPVVSEEIKAWKQKRNQLSDEASLELGVKIVQQINEEFGSSESKPFYVIGDVTRRPINLYYYRVGCFYCEDDFASLVPAHNNLEHNLREHVDCEKHKKAIADHGKKLLSHAILSGRPGRPTKVDGRDCKQRTIHKFFGSDQGPPASSSTSATRSDKGKTILSDGECLSLSCWGLWQEFVSWGGNDRAVKPLLMDQLRGQEWYSEPYAHAEVYCMSSRSVQIVNGLFRHVDCSRVSILGGGFENLTCSKCWGIKLQTDFRLRVYREERAALSRGLRDTGSGRRLNYLTVPELRGQARVYNRGLASEKLKSKRLMHRVCMLQSKIPSLRDVLGEAFERKDVKGFCSSIVLAHKRGAFGGKEALWELLRDIVLNLNRKPAGRRYSQGTKAIMQALFQHGGRRVIDCLAANMLGPSLNTLQRHRRGMSHFRPGFHEEQFKLVSHVYGKIKEKLGITSDLPCLLAEDETAVKRSVRWISRTDSLIGFCGRKEDHLCETGLEIVVGSEEEGFKSLIEGFENHCIGIQARCIIVNPLHVAFPRLCLMTTSTCNRFNAEWVRDQWDTMMLLWGEFCRENVGPVLGHSSDGDPRRRKLMLEDYTGKGSKTNRVQVGWEGWSLSYSKIGIDQDPYGLHDQDYIHNGKKLINPLDSPVKVLKLGATVATIAHVLIIYDLYSVSQHGLNREDISRTDRQNWSSAQRLMSQPVRTCLQLARERGDARMEMTLGTESYLEVCSNYVEIFMDVRLTLRQRIVLCGKVGFFFRLWRLWLLHGNHSVGGNTQALTLKNTVSTQTFLDIQMSVHFVVLMIVTFRDKYPHLPIPFLNLGSDACEQFFSKVGGMKGHERSYDFGELIDSATGLNRLAELELSEGVAGVGKSHKKHKNIWMSLHPLQASEQRADLLDYSGLATNVQVTDALQEGLAMAQNMCITLEMCPSTSAKDQEWFKTPWQVENDVKKVSSRWCFVEVLANLVGEDEFADGVRPNLLQPEEDPSLEGSSRIVSTEPMEDDLVPDACVADGELQHTLSDLMGEMEEHTSTNSETAFVDPTVSFEGYKVYKSTLVSQLVGNPTLSKDRLTRVKQSVYFNNLVDKPRDRAGAQTMFIQGGTDVGVYFVQREAVRPTRRNTKRDKGSKKPSKPNVGVQPTLVASLHPQDKVMWFLGRVQFIRKKYNGKWGRSREPVNLFDRPSSNVEGPTCEVQLQWFTSLSRTTFKYNVVDHQWIDVASIISVVSLSTCPNRKNVFILDDQDLRALDEFVTSKHS